MITFRQRGPIDANGRAIVLFDERHKISQVIGGKTITFSVVCYVQRDPLSDVEAAQVAAVKLDTDTRAEARKREEQGKREREITEATKRGTDGVIAGLKLMADIGPQLQRAASIAKAVGITE